MDVKFSFITTVYNESATIVPFLESILNQTKLPDEIVIVDAQSTDDTIKKIKNTLGNQKKIPWQLLIEKGNRSVGRNVAIKNSSYGYIACSDAGCTLEPSWLEEISKPLIESNSIDVVSGWYKPDAKTFFEDCLGRYSIPSLVKINSNEFLPSARSICFKKTAWGKIGGFNETMTLSEDTSFNLSLKKAGFKFVFKPSAIVYWRPRKNFTQLFKQSFSYNYSDAQKNILIYQKKLLVAAVFIIIIATLLMLIDHRLIVVPLVLILIFLFHKSYYKKPSSIILMPLIKVVTITGALTGFGMGKFSKITRLTK